MRKNPREQLPWDEILQILQMMIIKDTVEPKLNELFSDRGS